MHETELLILGLCVAIPTLSVIARLLGIPYPIVLVVGAIPLGYLPGVPDVELDPDLVLVIFLPPLLYVAAFFADLRALRDQARALTLTSIGLVLLTTCAVGVVGHELIGLSWPVAFALGAIVSPTDPVAATAIARQLGAPRRLVNAIEGESLVNDASALIAYRVAVAAAIGGSFSLFDASIDFVVAVRRRRSPSASRSEPSSPRCDGGSTTSRSRSRSRWRPVTPPTFRRRRSTSRACSPRSPRGSTSAGWRPELATPQMRMQGRAVWEFIVFVLNAVLFVLIGLQLPSIVDGVSQIDAPTLAGYALATVAVVVGARFLWLFTVPYLLRAIDRRPSQVARRVGAAPRVVMGWAGMRGAVSLAAALSLPLETDAGAPFPERDLVIFLAYCVVVFTVVVQGLTLPALIRRLGVVDDGADEEAEEQAARIAAAEAALERARRPRRRGVDARGHRGAAAEAVRVPPPSLRHPSRRPRGRGRDRRPVACLPAPDARRDRGPASGAGADAKRGLDLLRRHAPRRARPRPRGVPPRDLSLRASRPCMRPSS